MDNNYELYELFIKSLPKSVKIIANEIPGLSNARNIGIRNASGDIVGFMDDDAIADKNCVSNIIKNYYEEDVVGVFGRILPKGKPSYPEELYWIEGFTYKGFPEDRCEVRNGHGCNMSFRRNIFDKVGLFEVKFGRLRNSLLTGDETEISIRILNSCPNLKIIYDPSAIVYHKVHQYRQTFRYMIKRSFNEGASKAHIKRRYKFVNGDALKTEDKYLWYLLRSAVPGRLKNICMVREVITNVKEIVLIIAVIISVGAGYITGMVR